MNKEEKFWSLIHAIRKQYGNGISSSNPCCVFECEETVVGTGKCGQHLKEELREMVGDNLANWFVNSTIQTQNVIAEMLEKIEG